jgi:hypothetical protein
MAMIKISRIKQLDDDDDNNNTNESPECGIRPCFAHIVTGRTIQL